ncbi:hypothetical protein [Sorangium sp. So ce362]|uniref:hypothetical protein n=1 Tax=Sorangium sp. So ce362 TaxID=3133303 RepID=UPI003F60AEC2
MGQPAEEQRRATYADMEAVPPNKVAELIGGQLHVMPRPAPRHANASAALIMEIGGPFHRGRGGPGGWWILNERAGAGSAARSTAARVRVEPFDAVELDLSALWSK